MPIRVIRKSEEQKIHDKTVELIAEKRFSFPDDEHPQWKTYVNEPKQIMGIRKNSESVYPDIVVVDVKRNRVVMIGEVETENTVSKDEAEQWKEYSSVCSTFYLYVPEGYAEKAKSLLTDEGIKYSGLRVYSYNEKGEISIRNV